jgi:hypothetical protein
MQNEPSYSHSHHFLPYHAESQTQTQTNVNSICPRVVSYCRFDSAAVYASPHHGIHCKWPYSKQQYHMVMMDGVLSHIVFPISDR